MTNITIKPFEAYEQYKKANEEVANRRSQVLAKKSALNAELAEKQAEFRAKYTEAFQAGKDADKAVASIEAKILELQLAIEREEEKSVLAMEALSAEVGDPVRIVNEFNTTFQNEINPDLESITAKLEKALDLIMTAKRDYDEIKEGYSAISDEMVELSKTNKQLGRTNIISSITRPASRFNFRGLRTMRDSVNYLLEGYNSVGGTQEKQFNYVENKEGK